MKNCESSTATGDAVAPTHGIARISCFFALPIGFLAWLLVYRFLSPLPFYSFFADPELAYIFSSLELMEFGSVQLDDHPGTILQIFGALITAVLNFRIADAFDPVAVSQFRFAWLLIAVGSMLLVIWMLKDAARPLFTFVAAFLLLFHDFHALAFWGRFTPEGAFLSIYFPLTLFAFIIVQKQRLLTIWQIVGVGLLTGCATTVKITLWPVTLFLYFVFWINDPRPVGLRVRRLALLAGTGVIAYFILGSIFSLDRGAQLNWFLSLITESGRYGQTSDHGVMLPLAEIFARFHQGLQLQNYTTVVPWALLGGLAVSDLFSRSASKRVKILSFGFLLCLLLTFLLYAKHPYQIKYLLPQTFLFVLYVLTRLDERPRLPDRVKMVSLLFLAVATLNSLATYHVLHFVTNKRNAAITEKIDTAINKIEPGVVFFSLEIPHPHMARAFALREAKRLAPYLDLEEPKTIIFRERAATYEQQTGSSLPIDEISSGSLVITTGWFNDTRTEMIIGDPELGLFMYYAPPMGNSSLLPKK